MLESEALVRMQEIDLALMRHERTLSAMPQAKKISTIRAARKKLAQETSKVMGLRKDVEMEIEENNERIERVEAAMAEVQERYHSSDANYRELVDLEAQLTQLAKNHEKRTFRGREYEARLAKLKETEANAHAMDERLVAEERSCTEALHEAAAGIERDVKQLREERKEVASALSESVLNDYVAARRRFGGLAVETLRGSVPSICSVAISPSAFGDIARGPAITECPYCHRMLVCDVEG